MRDCPERFFEDKERWVCSGCHPDCELCDGPNNNDCDACVNPEATLHNGACVAACPSHSYRDATTGACKGRKFFKQGKGGMFGGQRGGLRVLQVNSLVNSVMAQTCQTGLLEPLTHLNVLSIKSHSLNRLVFGE